MKYFILFIATILFAGSTVYVNKDFNDTLPKPFEKRNFNSTTSLKNGFLILNYNYLPLILENNLSIISGIGKVNTYILSHKNINEVKVVANPNLPAKIFFDTLHPVKFISAGLDDFIKNKIDAIIVTKKTYIPNTIYYDLNKLGIIFNRYYLVADSEFLKKHRQEASFLSAYFQTSSVNPSVILTAAYLNKNAGISSIYDDTIKSFVTKRLKVAVTPYWPPFDLNDNGELKGIGIDFWKLIAKKAGLEYELISQPVWIKILNGIKDKKYDLTPNTSETPDRKEYALFSKPYIEFPFAVACRSDLNIEKIEDIKALAVGYNYTAHKVMKAHYPDMNFITAKSVIDAFGLVNEGKAQCVVDILPTVVWLINQHNIGNMRIFFKTPFTFKLQVMIRKDLKEIKKKIDDAIDALSVYEKNKIVSKYIGEKYAASTLMYSKTLYVVLGVMVIVIFVILYKVKKYKKESQYDALTKIYNRGTVEKIFRKKVKEGYGSIIFFDIDHFKKINDTYGHQKGDYVLKKLTEIIKKNIRTIDVFGRWGGEEFIIILPETSYENALIVAEKLREIVEKSDFDGINVTISLGVSGYKKNDDITQVLKKADIGLYVAKSRGRNQVKGME